MLQFNTYSFNLGKLSQYRTQLMGIAAIMIILCHAVASKVIMPYWVGRLLIYGNLGVDIFLFLSGLGCFYSLDKVELVGVNRWYSRRFKRLFPAYLVVYITLNFIYLLLGERNMGEALLSITTLEYWVYHRGGWFVSLIIPLYLLSPLLYKVECSRWKWLITILLIISTTVLCAIPLQVNTSTNVWHNVQFAFSRCPSFMLGMAIAKGCKDNRHISVIWPSLLVLVFIPLHYCFPNVFWGWLLIPLMLMILSWLVKQLENVKRINSSFLFMGHISLESYLMNISLNALLTTLIIKYGLSECTIIYGNWFQYTIVIVFGISIAYLVNRFCIRLFARNN